MKCKQCGLSFAQDNIPQARCPGCGTAVGKRFLQGIPLFIWLFSCIIAFGGLAFTVGGISSTWIYHRDKEHYAYVDAKIVEIRKEVNKDDEVDHKVYVSYSYDGVHCEYVKLSSYNSSMREGDWIQIEIDQRDPTKIVEDLWWLSLVGVALLLASVLTFYLCGIRPNMRITGPVRPSVQVKIR